MSRNTKISRRDFIKFTASAGGGLVLAFHFPMAQEAFSSPAGNKAGFEPNAFLRIDPDGLTTIMVPVPEIGQGAKTALPMIVAEELEVKWSDVRVQQADFDEKYGWQIAGGSLGTMLTWKPLRTAGAVAREMLIAAAAQQWKVAKEMCYAEAGAVTHKASGRRLSYGDLVEAASKLPVPDPETVTLKSPHEFRLVGQSIKGVECHEIVTGRTVFGSDKRVSGMLYATIERCPVVGGKPVRIDDRRARSVRGVREVLEIDGSFITERIHRIYNGVAVVAESTWAALKGREALEITWEDGDAGDEDTGRLRDRCKELLNQPGERQVRSDGNVENALAKAARVLEADYEIPFLAHAPMEPMNCIADVRDGNCEIWGPIQDPEEAAKAAHLTTGIPESRIKVHVIRSGGAFGRRLVPDFAGEAAYISRKVGAPIQIVWTREDDMQHDYYRTCGYHRLRGGLNERGDVIAWHHKLVGPSRNVFRERMDNPEGTELEAVIFPANFVANLHYEYTPAPFSLRLGAWRGIIFTANAFASQSFIDELAHAAGKDPVEFNLQFLGDRKEVTYYEDRKYDIDRARTVIKRAAGEADWGRTLPDGRGQGFAFYIYPQAGRFMPVAHVVEVSVDAQGVVRVHRVVSAVDPGLAVNPGKVEAQVRGGVIDGLTAAIYGEITVQNGRVEQSNFHDYKLMRMGEAPDIDVHIIRGSDEPGGIGEPPVPPVAPALTNAIFAATGKRVRRLPIRSEDLKG